MSTKTDVDIVAIALRGESGFHLDAQHTRTGGDDEIEGQALTVWLTDGESKTGGFENEDQLGEFALSLAIVAVVERLGTANRAGAGKLAVTHDCPWELCRERKRRGSRPRLENCSLFLD